MNQFFKTFFACLLAIVVSGVFMMVLSIIMLVGMISLVGSSMDGGGIRRIEAGSILALDLSVPVVDKPNENPIALFRYNRLQFDQEQTLLETVALIERAATDPNVAGIYLKVPTGYVPSSISTLYELRTALAQFREQSGKFVVSYADVYSQGGYYLASVGDKVYMNPQGALMWQGLSMTPLFFKGTLDKLGIRPELIRHGRFKGAGEPFVLERLSAENRLQLESVAHSIWGFMVGEIAQSRDISAYALQLYASMLAVEGGQQAVDLKLVDGLIYRDQMADELARLSGREEDGAKANLVSMSDYRRTTRTRGGSVVVGNLGAGSRIALVYAEGDIVDEGDTYEQIVGNELAATLREVREDAGVKAVVLRVNSGGGSALASEVIWREVYLLGQAGKPVIVSMGDTAASGGYYIAAGAEYILAAPTTLTGSIGVFGLLLNAEKGARELAGITSDVVRTNRSADMGNILRPMTDGERLFFQNRIDSTYRRFVQVVADGRDLRPRRVDQLGEGRVWTGAQAVENKLADGVGTLAGAIRIAGQRAGLEEGEYWVDSYPEGVSSSFGSLLESLTSSVTLRIVGGNSRLGAAAELLDAETELLYDLAQSHGSIQATLPYRVHIEY